MKHYKIYNYDLKIIFLNKLSNYFPGNNFTK